MQSDGAAAPPFLSVLFRALVFCCVVILYLSGLSLFFAVLLLVMCLECVLFPLVLDIFLSTNTPRGMAPFGSRPAAGRRARLR
jgi:hypothetical protein